MADITEVSRNIFMIDNRLFSIPRWGSVYLINETKKVLIECGPATSIPAVLEGIQQLGVGPGEIDYLIVTHIHLDHAGGAGTLMKHLPHARVIVHPKGARHLADPTRLVEGATAARGAEVIEMHGEVLPVDADRIMTVDDGETLQLGEQQTLTFLDTPGHASHHLCITESRNGGIFTGDVLALYITDFDILLPYHPPPQFDLDGCLYTFRILEKLSPGIIYYSHFGVSHRVQEHLDLAGEKLREWDAMVKQAIAEGTFNELEEKLTAHGRAQLAPMKDVPSSAKLYDYLMKRSMPMAADGHITWYRKVLNIQDG
ncbi:MAG: MBL fold metallo-hydrolase [Dehalococcoidales bacterium]|nr:MBL fold metallo-hydrolase [Dehalococcoidales bacterium]